jgi:lysophospholipase L1-like esterase
MLDQAQKQDPKLPVILCTVPETQNPKAPVKEPQRQAINAGIREQAAARENVELCDVEKAAADADGKFNPANFGPDKLHFGPAGYARWTAALQPIFEKLQIKQ